jgi:hypothetical protein
MNKWCPQVLEEIQDEVKDDLQSCWHDEDLLKDEFEDKNFPVFRLPISNTNMIIEK